MLNCRHYRFCNVCFFAKKRKGSIKTRKKFCAPYFFGILITSKKQRNKKGDKNMSKKNQNYTNRKQNRFQPERMRGNVFVNNCGKQWLPGENGKAAKVERLLRGAKEEKKEIAGNMAGYKDSWVEWIGAIPEVWKVTPLHFLCDIFGRIGYRGYTLKDITDKDNGVITLSPSNIINQQLDLKKCTYLSYEKYEESPEIKVYKNDIVFVKTSSIGKCAVYDSNEPATLNPQLVVVKNIKCNGRFLYYSLVSDNVQFETLSAAMGSVIPTITQKAIGNFKLPLPPLPEQQRIADFLDTKCGILDRTIDAVSRQIEDLEKYKKALITKTVTKGICKKDEPERAMKDSGVEWIGEVPEEWSVKRLKYVLDSIRNGASAASYEYEPDSFRYVRITDIDDNGNLKQTGKQYLPKEMAKNFILNKKAVLIANTGSLGKAMLFDPDKEDEVCALNGHLIEAIANPNIISNEYLYFFIKSYNYINWVNRSYVQTTMQMLSAGRHKNLPVTVPPLAEQQQIADYLYEKCKNIDNRVQKRRQQLEWLKKYKKSLIFDYVTGKKRVEK